MKKLALCLCALLLLLTVTAIPSAFAMETDFAGNWVCAYVDLGGGVLQTEYEGSTLPETIYFDLLDDGTVSLTSFGEAQTGTWSAAADGVTLTLDGMDVVFIWTDGMLVNEENGVVMYFTRPQPAYTVMDYAGDWVCLYVDFGDGEKLTEYEGQSIADNAFCTLNADGTLSMTSFGNEQTGTWQATATGISMLIAGTEFPFSYVDEQLVNEADGVTMFFARAQAKPKTGGFNDLLHIGKAEEPAAFSFAGTWQAVYYEVSGAQLDIALAFPDGLTLTLYADGSGFAQITPDYAEALAWNKADDGITLQSSYLLFGPVWDAQSETLTLSYATDIVLIGFQKVSDDTAVQPESTVQPFETEHPNVAVAAETPIVNVTVEPTPAAALPVVYSCDFFSVSFPEGWKEDEYSTYNWDQSYTMQYDLNDKDGWSTSDITVTASVEEVATYRTTLATLLESAKAEGADALDTLVIDGITFYGTEYGDYWRYADYTARIPEASVTLRVTVYNPEPLADVLPDILGSIRFTYPIPDTPLSDPPLPEDGIRFTPSPAPQSDGGFTLTAQWQQTDQPLYFIDNYSVDFTCVGDQVYILADQSLASYTVNGGKLTPAGNAQSFDQSYRFVDSDISGMLYLSDGYSNGQTLLAGETTGTLSLSGYLSMSPDGKWGLMYWGSDDVSKLTFTADGPAVKPWALKSLSDDTARQGRFSYINSIVVTGDSIFVTGTDATTEYATRIARYDFDGNELAFYGSTNWMDDSAIGTVTGIVQTENGILVEDGFYNRYLMFTLDGTYIGAVSSDDLLGTSYASLLAMVPSESGMLALVSQEREDHSAVELLVFEITGF